MNLKTKNLEIRPFELIDTKRIFELSQEESLRTWIPDQVYENEQEAKEVLNFLISQYTPPHNTNEKPLVLAVALKNSNEVIGHVGLSPFKKGTEIGYAIGEKYTGNGYATEAVQAVCDWALSELNLNKVWGIVASENIGSYKVLEKAKFEKIEELEMNYLGRVRMCKQYTCSLL